MKDKLEAVVIVEMAEEIRRLNDQIDRWREYADNLRSEIIQLHKDSSPITAPYFRCGDHQGVTQINCRGFWNTECGECARIEGFQAAVNPYEPPPKEQIEQLDPGEDRRS